TFKIRQGVKFHNGQALTADDVVYTYKLHTNPKSGANALSAFGGVLLPAGVKKVDDQTVEFHLHTPKSGATFTRNEGYWGTKALPSQTVFTFYDTQNPSIVALTGGTIDVLGQFAVSGGQALLNGSFSVIKLKSSAHRELSMRCDQAPFNDPRV